MATVIGVGMQMTANASGMTKGLSDADKALQLLQKIVDQNQKSLQRFTGEADKTTQQLDKLTKGVSTLSTIEIGRVLVDTFQALGSAFTSAAQNVLTMAGNVSSSLDSLNDLSARTGIGVESLQGYALAAKMAGVDTEAFGVAVQKLAVNIGKATPGDAMDKALRGINLSVAELRMLAPEQQFSVIGDAIAQLPTVAERAAVAVQVFGKQGAALAPLFREGAASIDELRERAERLGIIVSETQINNVADMNDAFDLVSATINGIIGQVVGNLAPAVTDVTNQFLKFVEEWSGAQGEGGTGIANAITDVLLRGAEIFAGVFDQFVGNFSGFTESLSGAGEAFSFIANILTAASEAFRVVFNVFEGIGNALMLGLGQILEGLGDWVSSGAEQLGRDLQASARAAMEQNNKELEAAATNAANAVANAFTGGEGSPEAAGAGAAVRYVQGMRDQIERERLPEVQVQTNIEGVRERLLSFLGEAGEEAGKFFQESQATLDTFSKMAAEGGLTADQIKIMNGFTKELNAQLEKETALRREATAAAEQQATADDKRIESLLKTSDASSKLQDDLDAVERKLDTLADKTDAESQTRRDKLLTLRDELKGQQQAVEQGFGQGFAKAFEDTDKAIQQTIEKAGEFGAAGSAAAAELVAGVEAAKALVKDEIIDREAFELEVARQQQFFQQRVEQEQVVAREREAAAQRVEEFLRTQLDQRQQAELEAAKQLEERKKQAALNVTAIEAKLEEEKRKNEEQRAKGNIRDARASNERIRQLEQARRIEQGIVDGRVQANRQQAQQFQQGDSAAQQFQSLIARSNEAFLQGIQNTYAGANAALAQSARVAEEQARRMESLTRPTNQLAQTADFRTAEGQALVQSVAEQAQDPALIEARLQTKLLNTIASGITGAAANYFNQPVAIVGAARLG